jgi:cell division protein FtsB
VQAPPTTQEEPRSRAKLTGRAAVLFFVLAVLAVSYASSIRAWIHQRGEINQVSSEIAESEAAIASLELEKKRWKDPAYIEAQARTRFGWLMPGEIGYRVIDREGEVLAAGNAELSAPVDADAASDEEWWQTSWGSVVEAGKTPEQIAREIAESRPDHEPAKRITPDGAESEDGNGSSNGDDSAGDGGR